MIKSKGIRLKRHVASMGQMRNKRKILIGKSERKRALGRHRSRLEIIVEWVVEKQFWRIWIDLSSSGQKQVPRSCENRNKSSSFIKGGEFNY
jgi:hypothetical protein